MRTFPLVSLPDPDTLFLSLSLLSPFIYFVLSLHYPGPLFQWTLSCERAKERESKESECQGHSIPDFHFSFFFRCTFCRDPFYSVCKSTFYGWALYVFPSTLHTALDKDFIFPALSRIFLFSTYKMDDAMFGPVVSPQKIDRGHSSMPPLFLLSQPLLSLSSLFSFSLLSLSILPSNFNRTRKYCSGVCLKGSEEKKERKPPFPGLKMKLFVIISNPGRFRISLFL